MLSASGLILQDRDVGERRHRLGEANGSGYRTAVRNRNGFINGKAGRGPNLRGHRILHHLRGSLTVLAATSKRQQWDRQEKKNPGPRHHHGQHWVRAAMVRERLLGVKRASDDRSILLQACPSPTTRD